MQFEDGGICRKQRRSTNTNCQNAPTLHQLSHVTDSQMPQERITEGNKTNEGQYGKEDIRKMDWEKDTWTIPM